MKYIEKLLNGAEVQWMPLGEVAELKRGRVISKEYLYENVGDYPVYSSQTVNNGEIGKINTFDFEQKAITWTTDGANAGTIFYRDGRFSITNICGLITIKDTQILSYKYLYYWLSIEAKKYVYSGMGNPKLMSNQMGKVPIPIPPLAVQEEIIRILDKFTTLETELEAELDCRKRQYEYYRNQLLSLDVINRERKLDYVESVPLGKIGEIRMCKRILKEQTKDSGDIPFYKIGTFGKTPNSYISKELFKEYKLKYNYPKIGEVLISASGTIGKAVIFDGEDAYFQDSNIVWIENDESMVLNKYLFYCYQIARWKIAEGGTIQRLYNDNLKKTMIPVPYFGDNKKSLAEQQRIVSILDKFETLTTSISEGLPKEIALRRKQYEYYRNQLLSFA